MARKNPQAGTFRFVGREGFEPPKAEADRFTVCCNRPLYHLPNLSFPSIGATSRIRTEDPQFTKLLL
jgi:hypothetical protein